MLIYEKWVTPEKEEEDTQPKSGNTKAAPAESEQETTAEPERKLFGAEDNIPTDNDPEVTYKDSEGQSIGDVTAYTYFYEKGKKLYASTSIRQVPDEANDTEISAWVGDECIAGDAGEDDDSGDDGGTSTKSGNRNIKGEIEEELIGFTISYTKPRYVTVTPKSGTVFESGEVVELELVADAGRQIIDTPVVYVNDKAIEVVIDGSAYKASFEIAEDVTITFDVHTTAAVE